MEDLRAPQSRALVPVSASNSTASTLSIASLASHYGELFLSKDFSDVYFLVGNNKFRAHKLVLSARVPYFKRFFLSGTEESQSGRIEIKDVNVDCFYHVLKFIYSGELPGDLDRHTPEYLSIADKYEIEDLRLACSEHLKKLICPINVVQLMIMAEMYACPDLKKACLYSFSEWKRDVPRSDIARLVRYPQLMLECLLEL